MPLSQQQVLVVLWSEKADTKIMVQMEGPKKVGSKSLEQVRKIQTRKEHS